jgi:hypothetical protein
MDDMTTIRVSRETVRRLREIDQVPERAIERLLDRTTVNKVGQVEEPHNEDPNSAEVQAYREALPGAEVWHPRQYRR